LPTVVASVNATFRTPSCQLGGSPVSGPCPETVFTTLSGTTSSASSSSRIADSGVCSAGWRTVQFPVARAGASFQAAVKSGLLGARNTLLSTMQQVIEVIQQGVRRPWRANPGKRSTPTDCRVDPKTIADRRGFK
jgi:hypothetical protein